MSEGIQGKVVLITGGGAGLGAETARLLAAQGARVAVAARRKDKLDAVVAAAVARAIAFAIEQPAALDINEIVLRPTAQEF